MRRSRFVASLLTTVIAAVVATGGVAHAGNAWCRLDDPGTVEQIRRQKKIPNDKIDQLQCPVPAPPATWPDELWLQMPCNHFMVFRKVQINVKNILDQKEVFLGSADDADEPSENKSTLGIQKVMSGPWRTAISGSLARPDAQTLRAYYIGKYEVSAIQYEIYRQGLLRPGAEAKNAACDSINHVGTEIVGTRSLPATDVTWFQAVGFADALTQYLIALDQARIKQRQPPTALPWVEGTPSFLRLPTEVEWEYAARGGVATPDTQQMKVYQILNDQGERITPTIEEIASINSDDNQPDPGSLVHAMGRKKPNLLGLYDMLGNADEITEDLFRPIRPTGALAAFTGGVVVRGGNATDPPDVIGVGVRSEMPLYRQDGPAHSATTGFRLVLSGPIFVSARNAKFQQMVGNPDLEKAFDTALRDFTVPAGVGASERQHVTEEIATLKHDNEMKALDASTMNQRLAMLQEQVDHANAIINEDDSRNKQQMLENLVGLAVGYNNLYRRIFVQVLLLERIENLADQSPEGSPERQIAAQKIVQTKQELERLDETKREMIGLYADGIASITRDGSQPVEAAIASVVANEKGRQDRDYQRGLRAVVSHIHQLLDSNQSITEREMTQWKSDLERKFIDN